MKIALILGGIMLVVGLVANVAAYFLEKNYKNKMNSVSRNTK